MKNENIQHTLKLCFTLLLAIGFSLNSFSQASSFKSPKEKTRILFVLDASNSMVQYMDGSSRMKVAKKIMTKMVDSLSRLRNVEMALRVFGHQTPIVQKDCQDTKLEVPFKPGNISQLTETINGLKPKGYTLIAQSILSAANDFPKSPGRNIIILITDGVEECSGDPCAIAKALLKKGVVLQPFIIGIGDKEELFRQTYDCVGKYFNANSEAEFQNVFNVIISQALNSTTAQINLLDDEGRPLETDVAMTLYDANSGKLLKNYMHTMNGRGLPDTLYLDPLYNYNLVVHTVPPLYKSNIEIVAGRHNTIALNAGQGNIYFKCKGTTNYKELKCIVRKHDSTQTIYAQPFNTGQDYLVGSYDIEILSVPRVYYKNIKVLQNNTTTVQIPQPGVLNFAATNSLIVSIFYMQNNRMVWVFDIDENTRSKTILMQPGNYIAVARSTGETRTIYTKNINFTVASAEVTRLTF